MTCLPSHFAAPVGCDGVGNPTLPEAAWNISFHMRSSSVAAWGNSPFRIPFRCDRFEHLTWLRRFIVHGFLCGASCGGLRDRNNLWGPWVAADLKITSARVCLTYLILKIIVGSDCLMGPFILWSLAVAKCLGGNSTWRSLPRNSYSLFMCLSAVAVYWTHPFCGVCR